MVSNLELVKRVDNHPDASELQYRFVQDGVCIGFIPTIVWLQLMVIRSSQKGALVSGFSLDEAASTFTLAGDGPEEWQKNIENIVNHWRARRFFGVLDGWRDEAYPIYGPDRKMLFSLERAATPLFGVVTYGVHLTAYVKSSDGTLKIWVPRRSKKKQTYPRMLDNTVGGGLQVGEDPLDCIVREAEEEASLDEALVRKKARAGGAVSYFHVRDKQAGGEEGLFQPEVEYVYDLELPEEVVPKPNDDEVQQFYLWDVATVQEALGKGEFKPNCAVILIDFFIRHGIITPQTEDSYADYVSLCMRLHRNLPFPLGS